MVRYALTVEYDGTPFCGFQRQRDGLRTVQGVLENALSKLSPEPVTVYAAGRTDAGVHAVGQVCHVDLERSAPMAPEALQRALHAHLRSHPVTIRDVRRVGDDFHARFDARMRVYRYHILNRRPPPALELKRVWHVPVPLDRAAMAQACRIFLGTHDFTTFRSGYCQARSGVKTITSFTLQGEGEHFYLEVRARSFLHHQVRSMVGSLKLVGAGRWSLQDLENALIARDRRACGPVAPPWGLYLWAVGYGEDCGLE